MVNVAMHYFLEKGSGHLVGISLISALQGIRNNPAYNASKAFISNYLEGLRHKVVKHTLPITITDIKPGYVDTEMAKGDGLFWVAPAKKAAQQIYEAISSKKSHAYITKRWRIFAWLLKALPNAIYNRL